MATEVKKLTKKQQKAVKYRSGDRKKPEEPEQLAVPEQDIVDEDQQQQQQRIKKSKKRKRDDETDGNEEKDSLVKIDPAKLTTKAKSVSRKAKAGADGHGKGSDSRKSRYIVFVGNLPYKVTTEDIVQHFQEACGEPPDVRLLTPKNPNHGRAVTPDAIAKSKGCAFVEFKTSTALQAALHLHHSFFKASGTSSKRKINVELTAGGGGTGKQRSQKLADNRERLEKQREKHRSEAEVGRIQKDEEKKKAAAERGTQEEQEPALQKQRKQGLKKPWHLSGANAVKLG